MAETLLLAAGASAGTASTVGTIISVGGSLLSGVSSIAGGIQGAGVSKIQARQAELAARQEELKGRETAAQIRRGLSASLASQNAIFAARGISPVGTPQTIAGQSTSQAARDIDIARFGATQSAGALRSQAQQYEIEGKAKKVEGFTGAAKSIYSLVK